MPSRGLCNRVAGTKRALFAPALHAPIRRLDLSCDCRIRAGAGTEWVSAQSQGGEHEYWGQNTGPLSWSVATATTSAAKDGGSYHEAMNFDPVAPHYDRLERWFSRGLMHSARIAHLSEFDRCRHALLLGEGPGRFLPLVLRQFPEARVTCVDSSSQMLASARDNVPTADRERVTFVEADIRAWQPASGQFDLIATNFFLDCFGEDDLAQIIPLVANAATNDANWLVADFNIPEHGFIRWRAAFVIGALYQFFRFAAGLSTRRLISPQPWMESSGFRLRRRVEFDHGLLRSDWWTRSTGKPEA